MNASKSKQFWSKVKSALTNNNLSIFKGWKPLVARETVPFEKNDVQHFRNSRTLDPVLNGSFKDLRFHDCNCFLTVHEGLRYMYFQYNQYLKF